MSFLNFKRRLPHLNRHKLGQALRMAVCFETHCHEDKFWNLWPMPIVQTQSNSDRKGLGIVFPDLSKILEKQRPMLRVLGPQTGSDQHYPKEFVTKSAKTNIVTDKISGFDIFDIFLTSFLFKCLIESHAASNGCGTVAYCDFHY